MRCRGLKGCGGWRGLVVWSVSGVVSGMWEVVSNGREKRGVPFVAFRRILISIVYVFAVLWMESVVGAPNILLECGLGIRHPAVAGSTWLRLP